MADSLHPSQSPPADSSAGSLPAAEVVAPPTLAEARARLRALADESSVVPDGRSVTVFDCVLWRMTARELAEVASSLKADGGVLLFLEPTVDVGWRRLVNRLVPQLGSWTVGQRFGTDVPVELRRAGLEVTDLVRFGLGPGELFSYALGRAEWLPVD